MEGFTNGPWPPPVSRPHRAGTWQRWHGDRLPRAERYHDAAARLEHALELDPSFLMATWLLGQAYILTDRQEEGLAKLQRAVELSGNASWMVATLAGVLAWIGRPDEARSLLSDLLKRRETQYVRAFLIAIVYGHLRDQENAFGYQALTMRLAEAVLATPTDENS